MFVPEAIKRSIHIQLADRALRGGAKLNFSEAVTSVLEHVSAIMEENLFGQWSKQRSNTIKISTPGIDESTINGIIFKEFRALWADIDSRLRLLSGKELLANLNQYLQKKYATTLTPSGIIEAMTIDEVPPEVIAIVQMVDAFSREAL